MLSILELLFILIIFIRFFVLYLHYIFVRCSYYVCLVFVSGLRHLAVCDCWIYVFFYILWNLWLDTIDSCKVHAIGHRKRGVGCQMGQPLLLASSEPPLLLRTTSLYPRLNLRIHHILPQINLLRLLIPEHLLTPTLGGMRLVEDRGLVLDLMTGSSFSSLIQINLESLILRSHMARITKYIGHIELPHRQLDIVGCQVISLAMPHDLFGFLNNFFQFMLERRE